MPGGRWEGDFAHRRPQRSARHRAFHHAGRLAGALRVGGVKTTAYVCVPGAGVHETAALVDQAFCCLKRGAQSLGGSVIERAPNPGTAPHPVRRPVVRRAVVQTPGREPFIAEFYDGRWDRALSPPSFWTVLLWALRIAPLVLLNTAWLWFGDRASEATSRTWAAWAVAILPALLFLVLAPAAIVVLPALLVVVSLIPAWRHRVRMIIVDVIGDAWLYRSKELDQVVLPAQQRVARGALQNADRVVLLGHSQGAELTRRVGLRLAREADDAETADDEPNDAESLRFVWVGSGENQLNTVRALARSRWLPWVLWPYLLAWPVFVHPVLNRLFADVVLAWQLVVDQQVSQALLPAALALGLGASIVAFVAAGMIFARLVARPPRDAGNLPPGPSWYVQSILDPVSFGSAAVHSDPHSATTAVHYVPAHPQHPWWQEHISYFDKPQTGHVLIGAGLERPAQLSPSDRPRVPGWLLVLAAAIIAAVLTGGYFLGGWQWSLLLG